MAGNIYDPTQPQGGSSLEELMQNPDFVDLMSKMGYLPGEAAMPEGMHVGGTYKAPHPLQFAAAAAQNILRGIQGPKMNRALAMALRSRSGETDPLGTTQVIKKYAPPYGFIGPAETYEGT